jgi:hypothetical protein
LSKNKTQNSKLLFISRSVFLGLFFFTTFPTFGQDSEPVRSVEINKKPFQDLTKQVSDKWSKNELDISKPFKVKLEAKLIRKKQENVESVSFDPENTKWIELPAEESGDPKMVAFMKDAIMAIGDSGFLAYFYNLGINRFTLVCFQNDQHIILSIESEQNSRERALTIASGINCLLSISSMVVGSDDERAMLNGIHRPSTNENNVILNFELPAAVGQGMLKRHLPINKDKNEQK